VMHNVTPGMNLVLIGNAAVVTLLTEFEYAIFTIPFTCIGFLLRDNNRIAHLVLEIREGGLS